MPNQSRFNINGNKVVLHSKETDDSKRIVQIEASFIAVFVLSLFGNLPSNIILVLLVLLVTNKLEGPNKINEVVLWSFNTFDQCHRLLQYTIWKTRKTQNSDSYLSLNVALAVLLVFRLIQCAAVIPELPTSAS